MRVTHVITRLIVGGAQENTVASVLGLRKKPGMQVELISGPSHGPEGSMEGLLEPFPGTLTLMPQLVRPVHPWNDWRALTRLTRIFRSQQPDLVHTHSGKAGVLGRIAAARAGVPIIVHTIHGPSFGSFQGGLANLLYRAAERHAGKVTTHFVGVADAMRHQYLAAGIGRPDQYSTIWSGFPLEPFLACHNDPALRERLGLKSSDIVIGKIARLFALKGHDHLLSIARRVVEADNRVKFLLVGDGPLRSRFETQAKEQGLGDHFVFTGLVPPEAVPGLLGIMDLLVHLSFREGLARALPQALAAAKPVIAYDCDGAGEICMENQTGFLVRPGDLTTLQKRILELVHSGSLRERLGTAGQRIVRDRFAVEKMVDDLHSLYLRLARDHHLREASVAV